jgi:adenine-specific DNA methylase
MQQCPSCGAERRLVGVMFPARAMCACEKRSCAFCTNKAVIVEFQSPVRGDEPRLPTISNDKAVFTCANHAPFEAPSTEEKPLAPTAKKVKKGKPQVHPAWSESQASSPPGSQSGEKVECAACKSTHRMRDRVMCNGTRSECPKCGHAVHTLSWEKED